jgi:uncharacterized protein YuzE
MKLEYEKDMDSAYIYLKDIADGEVTQSISLNDVVTIDMGVDGKTLGIEILDASLNLPSEVLQSAVLV